ncbi:MAG: hypothetical protein ACHQZR_04250 [Candidatus Limnocylindrales bacterium]
MSSPTPDAEAAIRDADGATPGALPGEADQPPGPDAAPQATSGVSDGATPPGRPLYKGEPLVADRGPGLGCFWTQVVVLVAVLLLIPVGVNAHWPIWLTGLLLVSSLVLVLLVSLTVIFLLRLVSADRRARRRPLRSGARPTVGQLEDAAAPEDGADEGGVRQ